MKFTDGNWLLREGVTAHYAADVYETRAEDRSLTVIAPCRPIRQRGDTLNCPTLTVRLSSPMPDVIRVRISHFQGRIERGPRFEIAERPGPVAVTARSLTAGRLTARLAETGWGIQFVADGREVTRSPVRSTALMGVRGEGNYVVEQLMLGVGECVYGLGERFTAFVKNGQVVDTWNRDGGANSEQAYKNVPFYLTNRGYGVFVNDPGPVSFEVASERTTRVQFSLPGESLDYFVIYGPAPKEVIGKYTALTGRPGLPPPWSFGLWLSTSFTTQYDEATVSSFIDGMKERGIPLSVFHYDCFWMRGMHWCDFQWDPAVFPDPPGMLRRLHERGLKVCVWINPYIAQASRLFAEGRDKGYFLRRPEGDVRQCDDWQAGMAIVDFTNPAARSWYQGYLAELVDMGVDAFKTDFGERIPTDVVYHDDSDPVRMHNFYAQLYNEAVWEALEAKKGAGEAVLFARSATTGGQRYPVHWGGDCWSEFEAMAESLRGGLSLGMCGFGFWSHDIGGFEGKPPLELYIRWVAFGLLSSHSRLHGSGSYRVPWQYDDQTATQVLRFFTRLKHRLMPYLWSKAVEASQTGVPVMRAMLLEFPDDPACHPLDRQYMLGDSLLVAPVFSPDGAVEYYVPEGRWTRMLTGEEILGPRWIRETHGACSLPLLVRPGTLLAVGSRDDRPDYDYCENMALEAYALGREGAEATLWSPGAAEPLRIKTEGADRAIAEGAILPMARVGPGIAAGGWRAELSR